MLVVHLTADEIALLAEGASVAHCPSSKLKLGSGIAPVEKCSKTRRQPGWGTDGAANNNRLDLLGEMRRRPSGWRVPAATPAR